MTRHAGAYPAQEVILPHWYRKDGTPRYDATLREAKKEHLVPGATDVCGIVDKPGLNSYAKHQLVEAVLRSPMREGEELKGYKKRVFVEAKKHSRRAMKLGNIAHKSIEMWLRDGYRRGVPIQLRDSMNQAIEWMLDTLDIPTGQSEFTCVGMGYAGRVDWMGCMKDGSYGIIDFKTQFVDKRPKVYKSWHYQLAGYRATNECSHATWAGNLIISTNPDNQGAWWRPVEDWYKAQDGFDAALKLWRVENNYYPGEDYDR